MKNIAGERLSAAFAINGAVTQFDGDFNNNNK